MATHLFPCDQYLAEQWLTPWRSVDRAIILRHQEPYLLPLLERDYFIDVISLPEPLYGTITSPMTETLLASMHAERPKYHLIEFPFSDCNFNPTLLATLFSTHIRCESATSDFQTQVSQRPDSHPDWKLPRWDYPLDEIKEAINHIRTKMMLNEDALAAHTDGEQPSLGLLKNMPYDHEVLSRYLYASQRVEGLVLDIGCGFGMGACLMALVNPSLNILAIDVDQQVIETAKLLWGDLPNLSFDCVNILNNPYPPESWDSITCFDVLEHVPDLDIFFTQLSPMLRDNALFIGSTPNSQLFPYRVNTFHAHHDLDKLRAAGVWPWHLQTLNEEKVLHYLKKYKFHHCDCHYPTFVKGLELYHAMKRCYFHKKLKMLRQLEWSVPDFRPLPKFYPCFSGHSFIFSGRRP